ncbi:MAG: helix-turn-helix transcriptional regulator [Imperialibacter sp.]|uniref:helix-turn-helix domain-containing protein n=1 Tax=Imperialibacter sp. TaxID=2038411 RepID=UPI0032EC8C6D
MIVKGTTTPSHDFVSELKLKGFKVIRINPTSKGYIEFTRRDFYKIALVKGKVSVRQGHEHFIFDGSYLRFSNPHMPYSSEVLSEKYEGFACFFVKDFFNPVQLPKCMQQSPVFRIHAIPALKLDIKQHHKISQLFEEMIIEQSGSYSQKDDVIRSYLRLLIHETLKVDQFSIDHNSRKASHRITSKFIDLIEGQYPVVNPYEPIRMRTPKDFAEILSMHVNYLNRVIKSETGKTTTAHISERLVREAKSLLKYTDWNISEISYGLGFDQPNHFSSFFKKQAGLTPKTFRQKV